MSVVDLNAFRKRRVGKDLATQLLRPNAEMPEGYDYRMSQGAATLTAPRAFFACAGCGQPTNNLVWIDGHVRCPECRGPRS